jgi:hypothetical protein
LEYDDSTPGKEPMRRNPEAQAGQQVMPVMPTQPIQKDINAPVDFGRPRQSMTGPIVAPGVTDPRALAYAAGASKRQHTGRYSTPVAGGPSPSIPRLDQAAIKGMSMADQAAMQRADEMPQPQGPHPTGGLFQGAPMPRVMPIPQRQPTNPILSADILPDEALKDPAFKEGTGSRYASSQPALALKYGVIRGGKRIAPQQLGQPPKGLKPETISDLETIAAAQKVRERAESSDASTEKEAAEGTAGAAGRLGNSPADGPQTKPPLSEKEIAAAVKKMDDFDFNTLREMMMKDIINNEDQKKIIEARCKPLDLTDMIVRGFVTQRVPIIPGRFEPEFQSMRGDEDLAIKRLIMLDSKSIEVTERYLLDKFSLMSVAIGLRSVNGQPLPTHLNDQDKFDEDLFWRKFEQVTRLPFHMLASIGVNYYWFDIRVRKLFVADALGNG